ncbi:RNA helicase Mov10l1-like [Amphibalanus amphitrite]|uniref:RNA helicase Mov10l1-like n=1 Tax=Amphibalanus amphitrite TaxID=1232801 RepID=UPI001C91BEAA|nr:RNA helicase Mov10l1-like [Amphibalanus amphitrite]XP_043196765.1 RNA helicase Mov10l1-like [Amphibalanus amphitrite]XP_043196766.1 RNA helicase Mov10l1-like [Amphibalanus amphitrite]XP_043196767.1 RNA helicase Mov10l1-like [Amphibalanus amphitrite]
MLSTLRAWLWGAPAPESAAPRPELHQFFPADEPRPTDARRWFEGSVLSVSPEGGTVSGDVWFEPAAVRGPRQPEVGERVRGEARRRDEEHAWLAIHVEVCDDDWGTAAEEAPAENRVVGQVRRFEGDVLVLADRDDEYRLRQADAEVDFLPAEGDWLELESDDPIPREVTGGQKVRVRPLRRWEVDGEVTLVAHEQPMFGLVDNQIYFLPSAWSLARLPRRGDRVRCSAVESSQSTPRGLTLNWRAVRVAALEARAWLRPPPAAAPSPAASASFSADLLDDKQGVSVSGDGEFGQLKCGEQRRTTLVVRNASGAPVTLAAARLLSNAGGQFSVTPPDCAEIPAGGSAAVTVECRAELLGAARALCLLDFGAFRIGRWLGVTVEDPSAALLSAPAPSRRRARAAVGYDSDSLDARQSCVVVPGQPAFKPAPFVSARLPPYPLPTRLLSMDGDRLLANYPCLASELGPDNYKQRLTLLLFIEEVEMLRQIRQFDMDGVVLGRAGEFLQLAVPGLAESRPSLVVGDKVLLSHPYEESGLKYEGYVHQVRHSALNIMFHPDFQQSYTGKEYNASFEFSRSQLRQLHRAVETALARLGAGVLFPTTATARLPQVNFVEEAGWSSERSVCSHTKRVSFDLDTDSQKMPPSPTGEEAASGAGGSAADGPSDSADPELTPRAASSDGEGKGDIRNGDGERNGAVATEGPSESPDSELTPRANGSSGLSNGTAVLSVLPSETVPTSDRSGPITNGDSHRADRSGSVTSVTPLANGQLHRQDNTHPHGASSSGSSAALATPSATPGPAPVEDTPSQSDSDVSFVSADGSVDESLSRTPSAGGSARRPRRSRRMPVVDRLFRSPSTATSAQSASATGAVTDSPSVAANKAECNGSSENGDRSQGKAPAAQSVLTNERSEVNGKPVNGLDHSSVKSTVVPRSSPSVLPPSSDVRPATAAAPATAAPASPAAATATSPPPLTSPLKTPPRSYAAASGRLRALSAVPTGQRAPFVLPRFSPAPAAAGAAAAARADPVGGGDGGAAAVGFCVPRMSPAPAAAEKTGVRVLRFFNRGLNERQKSAVRRVLKGMARPLPYIIYGPPGTGKTVTMVECILQTYTMCPDSRLLVATPSNSAADLITERLHASGAVHRAALARLTSFNRSEDSCPEVVQPYVMSGDSLEAAARRRIVVGTAATLGNLYRLGLRQGHFTHVFVDEAGHMTEPETLVPLGLVSALDGQAVLAGDPRQLGPVLQSRYAAAWGLQTSMLERLSLRQLYGRDAEKFADHGCYNPLLVTKLVNNYRSHRELLTVPSRLFYDSELVPCVDAEAANKWCRLPFLPRPGFPMLFHGVRGENIQEGDSPSWFNPTEAFQVIRYLQKLGSAGVDWDEVGVISPYRKQTEKIRELMTTFGLPTVKVGSVEEFQGQEREVIVLTTVRSSSVTLQHDVIYRLGFMQSPRRFNVAITRAKCLLIVIGNPELLAADEHWRHLVVHAVTNGAAIGCEGVL